MTKITLLLITLNELGAYRVTLSTADTLTQCQQQEQMVRAILETRQVPIITSRCGHSDLQLTPFQHGLDASAERYHYRVELAATDFAITSVPEGQCTSSAEDRQPQIICAVSSQRPVSEAQ